MGNVRNVVEVFERCCPGTKKNDDFGETKPLLGQFDSESPSKNDQDFQDFRAALEIDLLNEEPIPIIVKRNLNVILKQNEFNSFCCISPECDGDCMSVIWSNESRSFNIEIIFDCGNSKSFNTLKEIRKTSNSKSYITLCVNTHIHKDHINGFSNTTIYVELDKMLKIQKNNKYKTIEKKLKNGSFFFKDLRTLSNFTFKNTNFFSFRDVTNIEVTPEIINEISQWNNGILYIRGKKLPSRRRGKYDNNNEINPSSTNYIAFWRRNDKDKTLKVINVTGDSKIKECVKYAKKFRMLLGMKENDLFWIVKVNHHGSMKDKTIKDVKECYKGILKSEIYIVTYCNIVMRYANHNTFISEKNCNEIFPKESKIFVNTNESKWIKNDNTVKKGITFTSESKNFHKNISSFNALKCNKKDCYVCYDILLVRCFIEECIFNVNKRLMIQKMK